MALREMRYLWKNIVRNCKKITFSVFSWFFVKFHRKDAETEKVIDLRLLSIWVLQQNDTCKVLWCVWLGIMF